MSLGQAANWTANVFVSVTYLDAVSIFSLPVVFCFYLVVSIFSVGFIYTYVPETRNKTLEEITRDRREKQQKEVVVSKISLFPGQKGATKPEAVRQARGRECGFMWLDLVTKFVQSDH